MRPLTLPLALLFAALGLAVAPPARAEVFNDARVMPSGKFRLGIEPQLFFGPERPDDFITYVRFGFGVGAGADIELVGGFFQPATYIGANIEFRLLPDGSGYPALSIAGGAHFWYDEGATNSGNPGLDGTLLLSEEIRNVVSIYGGIDSNMEILPNEIRFPTRAIGGADIELNRHFHLLFELGINLHQTGHHLSGGIAVHF